MKKYLMLIVATLAIYGLTACTEDAGAPIDFDDPFIPITGMIEDPEIINEGTTGELEDETEVPDHEYIFTSLSYKTVSMLASGDYYTNKFANNMGDFDYTKAYESESAFIDINGGRVSLTDLFWFSEEIVPRAGYYRKDNDILGKNDYTEDAWSIGVNVDYGDLERVNKQWVNKDTYIESATADIDYDSNACTTFGKIILTDIIYNSSTGYNDTDNKDGIAFIERDVSRGKLLVNTFEGLRNGDPAVNVRSWFDLANTVIKSGHNYDVKSRLSLEKDNGVFSLNNWYGLTGTAVLKDMVYGYDGYNDTPVAGHISISNDGNAISTETWNGTTYDLMSVEVIFLGYRNVSRTVATFEYDGTTYTMDWAPLGTSYSDYTGTKARFR